MRIPALLAAALLFGSNGRTIPAVGAAINPGARAQAESAASSGEAFAEKLWQSGRPPFSFKYGGRSSSDLLPSWKAAESRRQISPGGETDRMFRFLDPATGLEITAETRTFAGYEAVDWVLKFKNTGPADTPPLEEVEPLDDQFQGGGEWCTVRHSRGSHCTPADFEPLSETLSKGRILQFESNGGRSSDGFLPYFNVDSGRRGIIGAIGWTGGWSASFRSDPSGSGVRIRAGMKKTHLVLHPGEEIRTPRIVLLNWRGADWIAGQNLWRRLVMDHYSPRKYGDGRYAPLCYATWGTDPAEHKFAQIKMMRSERLPIDVFWIDAGWFGHSEGGIEEHPNVWFRNRGNWWPNPASYPKGLKPLSAAARDAGAKFLVWMEPEQADPGTTIVTEHPDWFYAKADGENPGTKILNLGDPAARRGAIDLVSKIISEQGLDWYRQDFNVDPSATWADADPPDRVGMAEIRHVEGLYLFLDALRHRFPKLNIDNCAAGGRRLDLEMISRTVALWRSDLCAPPDNDIHSQTQTQGLLPWVPVSGASEWMDPGPFGAEVDPAEPWGSRLIYKLRSSYSAALVLSPGSASNKTHEWWANLKKAIDEYHEVQPFIYGDLYPLFPWGSRSNDFCAWQWDRPDEKAGAVLVLRRPDCASDSIGLHLRALDFSANYEVEIRPGLETVAPQVMKGSELAGLHLKIDHQPGSVLVFYRKRS